MSKPEIKVVTSWDQLPPVVYDGEEAFSTRVLEDKYRKMENAMTYFVRRCDRGEVRSKATYAQFKEILGL